MSERTTMESACSPQRRIQSDADVKACARLIHYAFSPPLASAEEWIRMGGLEHLRVERDGNDIVACLLRIPMGQYFGGKSVPMTGVAGVAVAPEARGRGFAKRLMRHEVLETASEGIALAGLFASTQTLYRSVGYEQAGHRFTTKLRYSDLELESAGQAAARGGGEQLRVVSLGSCDESRIRACYSAFARRFDGMLDRGEYVWRRVRKMREDEFEGFGFVGAGDALEGYVYLMQPRNPSGRHNVVLSDVVFTTPAAGRAIVGFLASFGTMMEECIYFGGPLHPLTALLAQQRFSVERRDWWMIRIADFAKAIAVRGYSPSIRARIDVNFEDELIESNRGVWTIEIEGGHARATRSKAPSAPVSLSARGAASVFAGLWTTTQAATLGLARGEPTALAAFDGVFGAGTPWMTDHF